MDQSIALRECFSAEVGQGTTDYALLGAFDGAYAARSRDGLPALVVPLDEVPPGAIGRRNAGCELSPHSSMRFAHGARNWEGPAAVLVCTDLNLLDTFAVLAADVIRKTAPVRTWEGVISAVEEWLSLLAPKGRPSVEAEIGLWGELWFLERGVQIGRMLAAWRGPERDTTDFFLDGIAVEIKTSRVRYQHFVSQAQVFMPVGQSDAWVLSIWVKVDPGDSARQTVPALADAILERAPDRAEAMRRIAHAGYSPADRRAYTSSFVMLEEPSWFSADRVPRVRRADPGVSRLRYLVVLDEDLRAPSPITKQLWSHFHGRPFELQT